MLIKLVYFSFVSSGCWLNFFFKLVSLVTNMFRRPRCALSKITMMTAQDKEKDKEKDKAYCVISYQGHVKWKLGWPSGGEHQTFWKNHQNSIYYTKNLIIIFYFCFFFFKVLPVLVMIVLVLVSPLWKQGIKQITSKRCTRKEDSIEEYPIPYSIQINKWWVEKERKKKRDQKRIKMKNRANRKIKFLNWMIMILLNGKKCNKNNNNQNLQLKNV